MITRSTCSRLAIVTLLAAGVTSACTAAWASSRKAEKIIKKHVEAIGGERRIKAVEAMRATGRLLQGGFDLPFTLWMKRPNLSRLELYAGAHTIVQSYDGETAWWINPVVGVNRPAEMPSELADAVLRWVDFDGPLVDFKRKRHDVDYVGEETLGTVKVHHLRLKHRNGETWNVYLSADTYLEVKRTYVQAFQGVGREVATTFDDYEEAGGLMMPRTVKGIALDGSPYTMLFQTIETDIAIDSALFKMP